MQADQTVIVTGGAGFIGSHLVDALVERVKRVVVIDKRKVSKAWKNAKATYKVSDIRDASFGEWVQKYKPGTIFHLAAHIDDRESVHEPAMNADNNIIGSLNVFEAARKHGVKKVLFASTGVVYGQQGTVPIAIDAQTHPMTPYAISKLTAEQYLRFYRSVYDLSFAALRLGNVYGPRQDGSVECGAIAIFSSRFLAGDQVYVNNDGKTTRDYVHVSDVVQAFLLAAGSDTSGVYNVGTGEGTETLKLYELVQDAVGVHAQPNWREDIQDELKHVALDASLTTKDFGWAPQIMIEQGVQDTVNWYRDR
jgi:UDP-glucose 4-epimerase